jgi:hypothetical protein
MKEKVKIDILSERTQSYNSIYNILTENLSKAKQRLSRIGDTPTKSITQDDSLVKILSLIF